MRLKLLFISFFFSSLVAAQISAEETYHGIFDRKNPDAPKRMDRWMVDLFHTELLNSPSNIKIQPWTCGMSFARLLDVPFDKKSRVGFAIGIGFSSQNFYSNGNLVYVIDSLNNEHTEWNPYPQGYRYKNNKLSLNYVEVPFQLRFRSGTKHNFFFYPGFKAGYLFNSHTKVIDDTGKYKVYRIHGLNNFQYGVTAHLGYNRFALFGYYSLTNIFADKKGPAFQLFSVGISLNFF